MSEGRGSLAVLVLVAALIIANLVITALLLSRDINDGGDKDAPAAAPGSPGDGQQNPGGVVINVAAPAMNGGGAGGGGQAGGGGAEQKTYLIAIDRDYQAFAYVDDGGIIKGFNLDLVEKVCAAGGMMCETVFDKPENCLENMGDMFVLGQGLQSRYYDACIGWSATVQRVQVGKFAMPYTEGEKAYFFYNKSRSFDPSTFVNKKIGIRRLYANNEQCLARKLQGTPGIPLEENDIVYVDDNQGLFDAIHNGDVEAGFAALGDMMKFVDDGQLDYLASSEMSCVLGGDSIVTRKDSHFTDLWDAAFSTILRNGVFNKLCKEAVSKHGSKGDVPCVDSYDV